MNLAPTWLTGPKPWQEPPVNSALATPPNNDPIPPLPLFWEEQIRAASNPNTPSQERKALAALAFPPISLALVNNPAADTALLHCVLHRYRRSRWRDYLRIGRASRRPIPESVAVAVAQHPAADTAILNWIARYSNSAARRLACRHPRATITTRLLCRKSVIRDALRSGKKMNERELIFGRQFPLLPFLVVSRGHISLRVLWRSSRSIWWEERLAAAIHPRAGRWLLCRLARDGNSWVRAAASARLRGERISWDHGSG